MSNGRVDTKLDPSTVKTILDLIGQIEANLPFLVQLTSDEKRRLVKPHPGAKQVAEGIQETQAEAGMSFQDKEGDDPLVTDISVFVGLTTIGDRLSDLGQKIDDTRFQAGSEAWNESLIRYGILRQRQRVMPQLKEKLDRLQPLITSRSSRAASGPVDDPEPGDGE